MLTYSEPIKKSVEEEELLDLRSLKSRRDCMVSRWVAKRGGSCQKGKILSNPTQIVDESNPNCPKKRWV